MILRSSRPGRGQWSAMLWDIRVGGARATCRVSEGWDAELNGLAAAGAGLVHLRELGLGAGQAYLQPFGFAEPVARFGFGDAGDEVVADLREAVPGGWVRPQKRAAQAAVLVDAGRVVGASAVADGDLAAFEVADELVPFLVGGSAVFLAGPQCPATGDGRAMPVDHCVGVDGLVAHGGVDVAMPGDELGDVRRHAMHDRVGDEQPAEVVERVAHGAAGGVFDAERG